MTRDRQSKKMRPTTARRLLYLSGVISFVAFCAHILTFSPIPFITMGHVWPIHIAIFIPFIGMILALKGRQPKLERQPGEGLLGWQKRHNVKSRKSLNGVFTRCPSHIRLFTFALVVYVAANFFISFGHVKHESPKEKDGKPYLSDNGQAVSEIDDEDKKREAYVVRGFSGHWMFFSFLPFVYFWYLHDAENENDGEGNQATTSPLWE